MAGSLFGGGLSWNLRPQPHEEAKELPSLKAVRSLPQRRRLPAGGFEELLVMADFHVCERTPPGLVSRNPKKMGSVVAEDSWRAEVKIVLISFETKSCLRFQSPVLDPVAVGPLPVIPRQACSRSKVKVLD